MQEFVKILRTMAWKDNKLQKKKSVNLFNKITVFNIKQMRKKQKK